MPTKEGFDKFVIIHAALDYVKALQGTSNPGQVNEDKAKLEASVGSDPKAAAAAIDFLTNTPEDQIKQTFGNAEEFGNAKQRQDEIAAIRKTMGPTPMAEAKEPGYNAGGAAKGYGQITR